MRRIEAPVQAELEEHPALGHCVERAVDLRELERDRLLEEERLARRNRLDHEVDVGVGARADRDRVDVRPLDQVAARGRRPEPRARGRPPRPPPHRCRGRRRARGRGRPSRASRRACARSARRRERRCGSEPRSSPADPLPRLPSSEAIVRLAHLGARRHVRDADLPEGAARRPVVRRRPHDDHRGALGASRPYERLLELLGRRRRLRQRTRASVRARPSRRARSPGLTSSSMLLYAAPP